MGIRFALPLFTAALVTVGCSDKPASPDEVRAEAQASAGHQAEDATKLLAAAAGVSVGPEDAQIVVYELSDFQCPACRMVATQFLPALKETYVATGKVRLVFVDFPLMKIHPNAFPAALAARCASEQNAFWEYHDKLFVAQTEWGRAPDATPLFVRYAEELGVDAAQFRDCYAERRFHQEVQRNLDIALALKARGTPTFYVNGQAILGAGREVVDAIESALRETAGT